jgi:hypothetical protein
MLFTWNDLAALHATHGSLNAFDHDMSDIPEQSRMTFLAGQLELIDSPFSRGQMACARLGLVISEDGISVEGPEALTLANVFDHALSADAFDGESGQGSPKSVATALGFIDAKDVDDHAWQIREAIDLAAAAMGLPYGDDMPMPTEDEMAAMRLRVADMNLPPFGSSTVEGDVKCGECGTFIPR